MSSNGESCPVKHDSPVKQDECPVKHETGAGCPVKETSTGEKQVHTPFDQLWAKLKSWGNDVSQEETTFQPVMENRPPGVNEKVDPKVNDIAFGQHRQPGQTTPLSVRRAVSTIDKGDYTPHHQVRTVDKWVYPSEQQYYNAMKRKGYNPEATDVPVILAIHNMVNEQGWTQVKEWESKYTDAPVLKRFMGRPQDISPKAYLMNLFLGYSLPFDRHDWIVERKGREVRYVIDFYKGSKQSAPTVMGTVEPNSGKSVAPPLVTMHLDVRPALDSYHAVVDRGLHWVKQLPLVGRFFD